MTKDVLERAKDLDARAEQTDTEVGKSIESLIATGKRNRQLINWVIISIVFEALLSIAVIFTVVRTSQNSLRIEQTNNTILNNCRVGNEFRASEASLWDYILSISPEKTPTPDQEKRIAGFKAFLDKNFAPRDCSKL